MSKPNRSNKRVVQRSQVRIDLLRQVARQEAQSLAGLHRRARQHDALDDVALERVDGRRHREVGLAGPRRADAEGDVVGQHGGDVVALPRRAAVQVGAARVQLRLSVVLFRWWLALASAPAALFDEVKLDVVDRDRPPGAVRTLQEVLEHA